MWDNDENLEAIGGAEDDEGVVTFWHCKCCGRDYEIAAPPERGTRDILQRLLAKR